MSNSPSLQKILYGALFVLVLPILLIFWAEAAEPKVPLPTPDAPRFGVAIGILGLSFMLLGMAALRVHGGGWPMNIAPPPRFVSQGIYRFLPHPIYAGFCFLCLGVSLATRSASGLWLITPVVIACCVALVLGYERPDLVTRFGSEVLLLTRVLPPDEAREPTRLERAKSFLFLLFPWLVSYQAFVVWGPPPDGISAYFPFERSWPVWQWTEAIYASCYVVTGLVPLVVPRASTLRRFMVRGWLAMLAAFLLFFAVPLVAEPKPFSPRGWLGALLQWERALDTPAAAFPSFHVIWAWLAAEALAGRDSLRRLAWRTWAILVAISCVTTGMHALMDLAGAFLTLLVAACAPAIWEFLRSKMERIANSWAEWRLGRMRIINHSIPAGVAAFAGVWIALWLAGPAQSGELLFVVLMGLVGAALWAQLIEGSPALLRPFGYFGGVLGTAAGAVMIKVWGGDIWLVLAAIAASAPWVQAIGRLRCLVQGCCHGRPAPPRMGIAYWREESRVTRLTAWRGIPLHPTPFYSLLWNVVVGVVLLRLWMLQAALPLIAGLYLILAGVGRFVEEAYRGEPQTPVLARLRAYQWLAVGSIVAGAVLTISGPMTLPPEPRLAAGSVFPALLFAVLNALAMGVDFPGSTFRFARLT